MEVKPCKKCGKLFNYISGERFCPLCTKAMENKFAQVKQYVYDNPNITINDLSKDMEVSVRQIRQWIREEKLCFTDDSPIGIECESCGVTIKTGRFCPACRDSLKSGFEEAAGLNRPKQQERVRKTAESRMRFLD